jgi:hypothetical protein
VGLDVRLVPDWRSVAEAWDGIPLTLWGNLTATQVRLESDVGRFGLWSCKGEQTTWLRWVFDEVEGVLPLGRRLPEP